MFSVGDKIEIVSKRHELRGYTGRILAADTRSGKYLVKIDNSNFVDRWLYDDEIKLIGLPTHSDIEIICPMLTNSVSEGDNQPIMCIRERCAWWVEDKQKCAICCRR